LRSLYLFTVCDLNFLRVVNNERSLLKVC
jgi:hypothetical protein